MPSLLSNYFNNMCFVVLDSTIYNVKENGKCHGKIKLGENKLKLVRGEKLSKLEELMLEENISNSNNRFLLQTQAYAKLIGINAVLPKQNDPIIESILPKNFFVYLGRIFELKKGLGEISTEKGHFKVKKQINHVKNFSKSYEHALRIINKKKNYNKVFSKLLKTKHHQSKNLGFEIIGNSFYLYTKVPSYILYENLNNSYYKFPPARVATLLLSYRNNVKWNPLIVIEPYTHPSLPYTNKPYQKICTGDFKYDSIKKGTLEQQLFALMHFAKTILTQGYFSTGTPYNILTNKRYNHLKVNGRINQREVTNL